MSEQEPPDWGPGASAPALRASDDDRERVVALLREGAADGRLTLGELTERTDRAYAAKTLAELDEITGDLVLGGASALSTSPAADQPRKARNWLFALMGGTSRRGRWRVARRVNAISVMGGVSVDLRDAVIDGPEVVITAIPIMGGIDVVVPEGVEVELTGFVLMGGKDSTIKGTPRPGAPVVRVRAWGTMGGVNVRTPRRRERDEQPAAGAGMHKHLGH